VTIERFRDYCVSQ